MGRLFYNRKKWAPLPKVSEEEALQNKIHHAIREMIDELDEREIELDERELSERMKELLDKYNWDYSIPPAIAEAIHAKCKAIEKASRPSRPSIKFCTQCGAPLHGGKCEYCGTEY